MVPHTEELSQRVLFLCTWALCRDAVCLCCDVSVCVCVLAGLNQHVSRLWSSVSGLNHSLLHHAEILDSVQKKQSDVYGRVKNLNSSLNQVLQDVHGLSDHSAIG